MRSLSLSLSLSHTHTHTHNHSLTHTHTRNHTHTHTHTHTHALSRQVTAVQFADDGDRVFTGGLDNEIKIWDLRKEDVALRCDQKCLQSRYAEVNSRTNPSTYCS